MRVVAVVAPSTVDASTSSTQLHAVSAVDAMTRADWRRVYAGLVYLACTVYLSLRYFNLLVPSVTNDHWWPGFNTSGTQTFLADVFNAQLYHMAATTAAAEATEVRLDATLAMEKSYNVLPTFIDMRPPVARQLLLRPFAPVDAIAILRTQKFAITIKTLTPHCWLDFGRAIELAHTEARQARCLAKDAANAAVYLDAMLRNTARSDFAASQYASPIHDTIFAALNGTDVGRAWLTAFAAFDMVDAATEATVWADYNLTHWTTQMQNLKQNGFDESVVLVSALGVSQSIKITSIATTIRGLGAWTTGWASAGLWNDLLTCAQLACSLVRGAPDNPDMLGLDWDKDLYNGYAETAGSALVRTRLGPFQSIDLRFVAPPMPLLAFYTAFLGSLYPQAQTSTAYMAIKDTTLDAVPSAWHLPAYVFYGGNPLCPFGTPQPYVQHSFGYYDDCGSQPAHVMAVTRRSLLFSWVASTSLLGPTRATIPAICNACLATTASCLGLLQATATASTQLPMPSTLVDPTNATLALNLSMVQLATDLATTTDVLLMQPMLAANASWTFFGWLAIYDWLDGRREVYIVEGDVDEWTLVSRPHPTFAMAANPLELPQVACTYVRYICLYVTLVLVAVSTLLLLLGLTIRYNVDGANFFQFNRVVGSVWVGRPLLFLRGVTALVVLCTSPLAFRTDKSTVAYVALHPHTLLDAALVAGEATWVVYVVHDMCLPLTLHYSRLYAPASALTATVAMFFIHVATPFQATATLRRDCPLSAFNAGVVCTSGTLHVGSLDRLVVLLAIQLVAVALPFVLAVLVNPYLRRPCIPATYDDHALVSAAATAYLTRSRGTTYNLDVVACAMSGILVGFGRVFDIKLWTLFDGTTRTAVGLLLRCTTAKSMRSLHTAAAVVPVAKLRTMRFWSVLGIAYIVVTVSGSYTFLVLAASTMANDFWWVHFNAANTQAYLCNWFNLQLQLLDDVAGARQLDDPIYASLVTVQNATDNLVHAAPTYANGIQNHVQSLAAVITSLRTMDGCALPWIFTAYCYVDFGRVWEMANSATRQRRCARDEVDNGAVYLEGLLRNGDGSSLSFCWGNALERGVLAALRTSRQGQTWLAQTRGAPILSVADEVTFWTSHGIASYRTQWQNFKLLGVIESFVVQNGFGMTYPLTLKKTNATLQLSQETSFKMYWGWMNDLWAVGLNGSAPSLLQGQSLVRQASNFAFANTSLEEILLANGTLTAPLTTGQTQLRAILGPFGAVDMLRVAPPPALLALYQNLTGALMALLAASSDAQVAFWPLYGTLSLVPQPTAWDEMAFWGGDVNCPEQTSGQPQAQLSFGVQGSCGINVNDRTDLPPIASMRAMLASGLAFNQSASTLDQTCRRDNYSLDPCLAALGPVRGFLQRFVAWADGNSWVAWAKSVKLSVGDLDVVHYVAPVGAPSANVTFARVRHFTDVDFELFSWLHVFDWVQGTREAVTFRGDMGSFTTLSNVYNSIDSPSDPMEVPLNVALYLHRVIQYFTFVLICVATIMGLYILSSHGHIEGLNMFSFNRVGGLVWLGRPFMLVRGITALCLLSTASLELDRPFTGLAVYFGAVPPNPITTFFSSGEASWIAYILNDLFSTLTKQYTSTYSFKSSLLLWGVAAVWSFVQPVVHSVELARTCHVVAVDAQVVCQSGVVAIGSSRRFIGLLGLAGACCVVCYAIDRLRFPHLTLSKKPASLFLYAAAKHQFRKDRWEYRGVYFLDRASAALNGVLSVRTGGAYYVFDVKTWRLYVYDVEPLDPAMPSYLKWALPLPE
ncbi:Aste57867_25097 [Aphanomyces stellatus]|uniref:Aste57867_25097 protein n=1 Tax=Aphanomyces stellatus TaxID=120398 RepID=A0A485LS87_9STRA|nr:hypothetical protein As57867_025019 [Aphanomyces stellatus]VFU01728.1 Aste57867_25097 [Aphanomyces stellatus]